MFITEYIKRSGILLKIKVIQYLLSNLLPFHLEISVFCLLPSGFKANSYTYIFINFLLCAHSFGTLLHHSYVPCKLQYCSFQWSLHFNIIMLRSPVRSPSGSSPKSRSHDDSSLWLKPISNPSASRSCYILPGNTTQI